MYNMTSEIKIQRIILIAVLVTLLKSVSVSCTRRPIIGVLAQEFSVINGTEAVKGRTGKSSYIAASYIKAVESSGARTIPIFVNRNRNYYERILYSINGVVIPGGDSQLKPGYPYYDAFTTIIEISEEMNKKGIYFPILAVCLGFEAFVVLYNGHKDPQTTCKIHQENYPLKFEPKFTESLLFANMDHQTYINLKYFPVTINNHFWCTTQKNFTKSRKLSKNWKITSTGVSSRGLKFIATIEHKEHPFIGVQFHPEKAIFEWKEELNLPHSEAAIQANRYFYDVLVKLSKLNSNKFATHEDERNALIYNYKPRYQEEYSVFVQIYVFE
ncbi:gamma-glutamyl hydrolase-like [Planococcus citri]|uniref:gamma-glutamyl hydrolase-like n=1 Tax=Planococcus citri TaxID=170843 RepID=UPI0031F8FC01